MRLFVVLGWGLMAAVAAIPATAAQFDSGPDFLPFVQYQPVWPGPQRNADGPAPQRDMRVPGEPNRGRMSPDERRQLRRDIDQHGRELYRGRNR